MAGNWMPGRDRKGFEGTETDRKGEIWVGGMMGDEKVRQTCCRVDASRPQLHRTKNRKC